MSHKNQSPVINNIQNRIFTIRGQQVMIDRDLTDMYHVETKVLNQAVKRNLNRFPELFRFTLTEEEKVELVTICDRFRKLKHSSVNPSVFTEQGVAMLASVLRSDTAVKISIQIMQAFVEMRKFIATNSTLLTRVSNIEQRVNTYDVKLIETDNKFEQLFKSFTTIETHILRIKIHHMTMLPFLMKLKERGTKNRQLIL